MKKNLWILGVIISFLSFLFTACDNEDDDLVEIPTNGLVASAGDDQTVIVNSSVILDGSASINKNNKPFLYRWSIKSKPAGSNSALQSADEEKAEFTPDVAGLYILQLTISQDKWEDKDEVIIKVNSTGDPNEPATVVLAGLIDADRTLMDIFPDPGQPDYLVAQDVSIRADLVIMPGVTILFEQNKGMEIIDGSISARGNEQKPIIFQGVNEEPGYWKGIEIFTNSVDNVFEHVTIRDAGSEVLAETGTKAALGLAGTSFSGATVKISNSTITGSGGYAFYAAGMSTVGLMSENAFLNNAEGVFIPVSQLHQIGEGNTFSGNNFDGVETGGDTQGGIVTWKNLDPYSYQVTKDISIGAGVSVQPGTVFKMARGIEIKISGNGYLNATGTPDARIIFTSLTAADHWDGLYFNSQSSNNKLIYTDVSNAGLNKIADAAEPANISLGNGGQLILENTAIMNGVGFGLVAKYYYQVNENMALVNTFSNLSRGIVLPRILLFPDRPALTGDWVDMWSLNKGINTVSQDYFSRDTGVWFEGAETPWKMNSGKGLGIHISENGNFTWAIGESSPMTGCESYSAEFITGTISVTEETITFAQDFWQSKFINACDPSQNVDIEITPSDITLKYEYDKLYNMFNGEVTWALRFTNPDGSTFLLYKK